MSELNEMFEKVMSLRVSVNNINAEIIRKREEFDASIKNLKDELLLKKVELDAMMDYNVVVRFGDLVDELVNLFNFDYSVDKINYNISTSVNYYGKKDKNELISLNNNSKYRMGYNKDSLYVYLDGTKKTARYNYQPKSFSYSFFLPLDLEAIQADGKSLFEHCSVKISKDYYKKQSSLVVDKNVEDLLLNIDMKTLLNSNKTSFFPADMFREAVGRCLEKDKIKIKERQP